MPDTSPQVRTLAYPHFHSGFNEDRRIREQWPACPARGVFVDVGAGNGITASNTLHFARNGWSGLLIDADPRQIELLEKNRPGETIIHSAICDHTGQTTLFLTPHLDHASLLQSCWNARAEDAVKVPANRLETILRWHSIRKIDLISIDVEGAEMTVWHSMQRSHDPSCVIIEHEHHTEIGRENMRREFEGLGYRLIESNISNFVFLKD